MKKKGQTKLSLFSKNAEKALKSAVKHMMREHKLRKIPIAIWKNGKVIIIPPEKISIV